MGHRFAWWRGAESPSPAAAQIASVVRLVVLLTVAIMLRLRAPFAPLEPLDALLATGSVYVLITTFLPRRALAERHTHILLAADIILISALVWCTGAMASEYYLLYYLPILHGATRLNFRDAITTSVLAAVSYMFIALATGPLVPVVMSSILRAGTFSASVIILAVFFAVLAREARANRLLSSRLQEALDSVSAVYDVARVANTRESVQEVLETMLRQAVRLSQAESGTLAMLDDDQRFHVMARHGSGEMAAPEFDEALARAAIDRGEWISRETGSRSPHQPAPELLLPLFARQHPLGVLQIRSKRGLGERELELLSGLCSEAAMAIENTRLRAETKRAAAVDYLSGLYNRREFERRLEAEIRRTARHGGGVALVLLDVDDFKYWNDSYGHQAGDEVLQALAARIEAVVRSEDIAARYGGDEFAIILPHTDVAGARAVAEKLQRELEVLSFQWADEKWRITISTGVAASEDELSASLLLKKADRALYRAKDAGKNQICVWERGARADPAARA